MLLQARRVVLVVVPLLLGLLFVAAPARSQGVPGLDPNKCLAGKTTCVAKKIAGLLTCRRKCQANPKQCGQAQADCEQKVKDKFDGGADPAKGCFAKLEAKDVPGANPDKVCTTTGDTAAIEAEVDAVAAELVARLEGCPGAGGVEVGGACWFKSSPGASCDTTCSSVGWTYDTATSTFAGSAGSDAGCSQVAAAFGDAFAGNQPCISGLGCVTDLFVVVRCTSPATTSGAALGGQLRYCACHS